MGGAGSPSHVGHWGEESGCSCWGRVACWGARLARRLGLSEVVQWEKAARRRATRWTPVARGFDPVLLVVFCAVGGLFNLLIILDQISARGCSHHLFKKLMLIIHRG